MTTRVKQYHSNAKGPYTVFVRKKDVPIDPLKIQKFVYKNYKSCSKAFCVNEQKLKFEFTDVNEANEIVYDLNLMDYKVNVPADSVEVRGVINIIATVDIKNFCNSANGGFQNPNIPKVKILDAFRFTAPGTSNPINKVKITFEGTVLPDHIILDQHLIIRVRPYYPKPLFCEKCLAYNHTKLYCSKFQQKCA